jgi:hypothetical protein
MALHHYRVVVRGVFDELDDGGRERLRESLDEHDIFRSEFTSDGTLTYDHHLHAFNARLSLRTEVDDGASPAASVADVEEIALRRTIDLLAGLGVRGRDLRVFPTDMADMWGSAPRRERLREARSRDA